MKSSFPLWLILWFTAQVLLVTRANAQRKVSELTLVYDYRVRLNTDTSSQVSSADNSTNTVYIKGNLSFNEIRTTQYSTTTIFNANSNNGVILKEVSGQKLMIRISLENWQQINRQDEGLVFTNTTETKMIAGYKCMKAVARTREGDTYTVYYTNEMVPENKNYNPKFKNLDGLPLEYELNNGKFTIRFAINRINLNPVPASRFDIPKSGYRELTYEESKKLNGRSH